MVDSQVTAITPATHAERHSVGGADPLITPVLVDPHHTTHEIGGADEITTSYTITASDYILFSNLENKTVAADGVYHKAKEIVLNTGGTIRTAFDYTGGQAGQCLARVYKNGVAYGTERTATHGTVTYTEDLAFAAGDLYQIYLFINGGHSGSISNMYVKGTDGLPGYYSNDP